MRKIAYMRFTMEEKDIVAETSAMKELVAAFKALADDTRLRMLNLVIQRECCVCEVMQVLNISQTRASRNLSMLFEAGFFTQRKEGLWSLYSLKEDLPGYLKKMVEAVRLAMADSPTALADLKRLKLTVRTGTACVPNSTGSCSRILKIS
jgi:ArsR family transcriptional regulator, arsenate/arsenite/antimonite-responsive transcriptional repressor